MTNEERDMAKADAIVEGSYFHSSTESPSLNSFKVREKIVKALTQARQNVWNSPEVEGLVAGYEELLREISMLSSGVQINTPRIQLWKDTLAAFKNQRKQRAKGKCEHGEGFTDFCEPCERVHGEE